MLNLCSILEESALRHPAKDAFVFAGKGLSYAELDATSSRLAAALAQRGVEPACLRNLPQGTSRR